MTSTREAPTNTRREKGAPTRHVAVVIVGVALVATAVHILVSRSIGIGDLEPYGLIHSLPLTFWIATAVNALAITALLRSNREHPVMLGTLVVSMTTVLHGTVVFLESSARFPTAWLHSGYTQYVIDNLATEPDLGARFSWPGFFVMTATAIAPFSDTVPEAVLRFAPLVFALAYLAPLLVITRHLLPGWRAPWLAVAIFPIVNWVGQDYFAPQSLAFLLALVLIAISLTWFTGPARFWRPKDGVIGSGSLFVPSLKASRAQARPILATVMVLLLITALAVSHQMTIYVVVLQLFAIWAVRRGNVLQISVISGMMAVTWLSWGAVDYWVPLFDDVFGNFGNPAGNLDATIAGRASGNADHLLVIGVRMLLPAALLGAALLGLIRQMRARGGVDATIPLGIAAAFSLLLVHSYGGEGLLRAFLYASAFIAVAIAAAFIPANTFSKIAAMVFVTAYVLASVLFVIARYGNEAFERVTADEVALADCMYEEAPPGSTLAAISPHLAWQYTSLEDYRYTYHNGVHFDGRTVDDYVELMPTDTAGYLIITEPQLQFVQRYHGASEGWSEQITAAFDRDSRWSTVCSGPGGTVYGFESRGDR